MGDVPGKVCMVVAARLSDSTEADALRATGQAASRKGVRTTTHQLFCLALPAGMVGRSPSIWPTGCNRC